MTEHLTSKDLLEHLRYYADHDESAPTWLVRSAADEIERLNKLLRRANDVMTLKASGTLANNLCPDHRDKQTGKPCLSCEIERLQRLLDRALQRNNDLECLMQQWVDNANAPRTAQPPSAPTSNGCGCERACAKELGYKIQGECSRDAGETSGSRADHYYSPRLGTEICFICGFHKRQHAPEHFLCPRCSGSKIDPEPVMQDFGNGPEAQPQPCAECSAVSEEGTHE